MNILILAGTGAMGRHLVNILCAQKHNCAITSRSPHANFGTASYVVGNARSMEFIRSLLNKHWDVIVDFMVYRTNEFEERISELLNATDQYIYLSSARVFADSDKPIKEDSIRLLDSINDQEYLATDEYALAKARQENILKNAGDNWTIIRPYITYDSYRLQLGTMEKESWLYRALNGKTIVVSKQLLSHYTTLTYGNDVSKFISKIVGNKSALSQAYNITCGQKETWNNILNTYTTTLNRYRTEPIKIKIISDSVFWKHLGAYVNKHQTIYDRYYDREFDNTKIKQIAPEYEFIPPQEGLIKCIEDFCQKPNFKDINWAMEGRMDKLCHEYTSLFKIPGLRNKMRYTLTRLFNL